MGSQASSAFEKLQFNTKQGTDDVGLEVPEQLDAGFYRTTGSEQIVDDPDASAGFDRVGVHVERIATIFKIVGIGVGFIRELARLAHRNKGCSERKS